MALIWGGTFVAGRQLAMDTPPMLSASLRFLLAAVALYLFLPNKRVWQRFPKRHVLRLILMGACGIYAYNLCFFYGFQWISASRGSLIVALNPAAIGLVSFVFLHERLKPVQWFGIGLSILGVVMVILAKDDQALATSGESWLGDVLLLGCVASWAAYSLIGKPVIEEIGARLAVFHSLWIGALLLTITASLMGDLTLQSLQGLDKSEWLSLIFLGVFGSAIAYVWYYRGIELVGATQAGSFISLVPVFGVILGVLLLNEAVTPLTLGGGALAVFGVYLCNRKSS